MCGCACKYIRMYDLFHPWSFNRNVIPPSVQRSSPEGQPLNLALTSEITDVKHRHGCVCFFVGEKETSRQKLMLATVKGKVLIDLHSSSCVVHLEHQDIQYCNPLTLTYVILLAYQQSILSPRGRQAGQCWPPLNTSLLLHLDFICVVVGEHLRALSHHWRSLGWMDIPVVEDTAEDDFRFEFQSSAYNRSLQHILHTFTWACKANLDGGFKYKLWLFDLAGNVERTNSAMYLGGEWWLQIMIMIRWA